MRIHLAKMSDCVSRSSSTSDLAGHMLLGGDYLVHVRAYGSLQRGTSCLTALHYGFVLGLRLTLNQTVHGVRNLISRTHTHAHTPLECMWILTALQIPSILIVLLISVNWSITSVQFFCLSCSFPFRRGLIRSLSSGSSFSITKLARI